MNFKKIGLSVLLIAGVIFLNRTHACDMESMCPYVGADLQLRQLSYKQGFGSAEFKKNAGQPHFYGGIKINDFFGVEAGFSAYRSKSEAVNKARLYTLHAGLVGYAPMADGHSLIGSAGIASGKARFDHNGLGKTINLHSKKNLLRLMVGTQHVLSSNLSLRLGLIHEKTSKLLMSAKHPRIANKNIDIKPKDSVTYSLGLIYRF